MRISDWSSDVCSSDLLKDVAIVRVEQLYPFPRVEVTAELDKYPSAKEVIWCQEEPMNQGAWFQIRHHLQACTSVKHSLSYAGRARSPRSEEHTSELQSLMRISYAVFCL